MKFYFILFIIFIITYLLIFLSVNLIEKYENKYVGPIIFLQEIDGTLEKNCLGHKFPNYAFGNNTQYKCIGTYPDYYYNKNNDSIKDELWNDVSNKHVTKPNILAIPKGRKGSDGKMGDNQPYYNNVHPIYDVSPIGKDKSMISAIDGEQNEIQFGNNPHNGKLKFKSNTFVELDTKFCTQLDADKVNRNGNYGRKNCLTIEDIIKSKNYFNPQSIPAITSATTPATTPTTTPATTPATISATTPPRASNIIPTPPRALDSAPIPPSIPSP